MIWVRGGLQVFSFYECSLCLFIEILHGMGSV